MVLGTSLSVAFAAEDKVGSRLALFRNRKLELLPKKIKNLINSLLSGSFTLVKTIRLIIHITIDHYYPNNGIAFFFGRIFFPFLIKSLSLK